IASSLVGAVITICTSLFDSSISFNNGSKYACVFPDPVSDGPITLFPDNISGIAFSWMLVGDLKNNLFVAVMMDWFKPSDLIVAFFIAILQKIYSHKMKRICVHF